MTTDTIFYTQITSIIVFLLALFSIYRLLVENKDSVIQVLKERIQDRDDKIISLESQTPNALTNALSLRIKIAIDEVERLKADKNIQMDEVKLKQNELGVLKERLNFLSALIQEAGLICEKCGATRTHHDFVPIYSNSGDREIEAEIEYTQYACGRLLQDGEEKETCSN